MIDEPPAPSGACHPVSIVHYLHEGLGLGHLKRTLKIAATLRRCWGDVTQLIVTGSPVAHNMTLPEGADYLKLPALRRVGSDDTTRRFATDLLSQPLEGVLAVRRDVLCALARHLTPDIVLVDRMVSGLEGELAPALWAWKQRARTRLVFGLRDILNSAPVVRQTWTRDGAYELLERVYDRILVYGQPDVCDVSADYALPPAAAAKVRYVGYLGEPVDREAAAAIRARFGSPGRPLILVTAGGGRDGLPLLGRVLETLELERAARLDWLLVGGPLMPGSDREAIRQRLGARASVHLVDAVPRLVEFLAAADAVVSMAGYNTVCEILSVGCPAVVVPRLGPNDEQVLRAEILSRRGLFRMIRPTEVTPDRLLEELAHALARPPARLGPEALGGLAAVERELAALLRSPSP